MFGDLMEILQHLRAAPFLRPGPRKELVVSVPLVAG